MNQITETGSVQLLGSGRGESGSRSGGHNRDEKNTNKQRYQLDGDDNG